MGTGGNPIWVWDLEEDVVAVLEGHDQRVSSVAFSRDGDRIVSGSYDRSVRLWNAHTLEPLLSLRGHTDPVTAVAFSADGNDVLSSSFDNTVRIWRTR